ncbi:hypothetical protein [Saccharothrix carnea]|nr:hypothetical protein [Saccharothrix carnea]
MGRDEVREHLIAAGASIPATSSRDHLLTEPLPAGSGPPLSEVVLRRRSEERW